MRIALDAMGGDNAPDAVVRGAVAAVRELGVEVALVGPPEVVQRALAPLGPIPGGLSIVPASDVIGMEEHGATAARRKRGASINVGLREVKEGRAAAFVSAGNTGAVMAASIMVLGRVRGIDRPALCALVPADGGRRVLLLDVGANAEVKPAYLVQFAEMGQAYAHRALDIASPRVGLLSIGEEESKGSPLVQEAHELMTERAGLNFIGNVEGKDIPRGAAEVVVTDGFTGNVALKVAEGVVEFIMAELRRGLSARLHYRLAARVLLPALRAMRSRLDYAEYGGAPLLGVEGVVIVAHGRSNDRAITNAVRAARDAVAGDVLSAIRGVKGS